MLHGWNGFDRKYSFAILVSAACLQVSGCASGPANTQTPSTYDLLFRKSELDSHLANRREYLAGLQTELASMDESLDTQMKTLSDMQFDLLRLSSETEQQSEELSALRTEVYESISAGQAARTRLAGLNSKHSQLISQLADAASQQTTEDPRIGQLEADIRALRSQIAALETTNARLVESHARLMKSSF